MFSVIWILNANRGVKNEPPRGTADAETGISEEIASNDCNVEDKEE